MAEIQLKYELTDATMVRFGITFHRIKRISNGELGGWIESEKNLDQSGSAWVSGSAFLWRVGEGFTADAPLGEWMPLAALVLEVEAVGNEKPTCSNSAKEADQPF